MKNHVGEIAMTTATVIHFPLRLCSRICPPKRLPSSLRAGGWSQFAGDTGAEFVADAGAGLRPAQGPEGPHGRCRIGC